MLNSTPFVTSHSVLVEPSGVSSVHTVTSPHSLLLLFTVMCDAICENSVTFITISYTGRMEASFAPMLAGLLPLSQAPSKRRRICVMPKGAS